MVTKEFLTEYIEELKELEELGDFPDLESRMSFAAYVGECEGWLKNGTPITSAPCSLCGGEGKHHDYEDEWPCLSCFGTGLSLYPE